MVNIHVRTDHWPLFAENTVARCIPHAYDKVYFGNSAEGKYQLSSGVKEGFQFVISYQWPYDVFIVWNAALHRLIRSENSNITFSAGNEAKKAISDGLPVNNCIKRYYKNLKNLRKEFSNCVEVVLVVGKDAIYDFCQTPMEYMLPSLEEIPAGKICLYAKAGEALKRASRDDAQTIEQLLREREIVTRAKRDNQFRQLVLDRWNRQCIVCGAKELTILEAAHKVSVKDGGCDAPENGYCLCANHHLMYDHGLIDIDEEAGVFACHSSIAIQQMAWYKEAKEREFRLYLK